MEATAPWQFFILPVNKVKVGVGATIQMVSRVVAVVKDPIFCVCNVVPQELDASISITIGCPVGTPLIIKPVQAVYPKLVRDVP